MAVAAIAGTASVGALLGAVPAQAGEPKPHVHRIGGSIVVVGTAGTDKVAVRLAPGDPDRIELDLDGDGDGDRLVRLARVAELRISLAGAGDDVVIDDANGVVDDRVAVSVHTGSGDDRITGGAGAETLSGGSGDDSVRGGRGVDAIALGGGADTFEWSAGDGSDAVDGGGGVDVAAIAGDAGTDRFELSSVGDRVRLSRAADAATLDLARLERADLILGEGRDSVVLNDLRGTDLTQLGTDLAADTDADLLTVLGTDGDDAVAVTGTGGTATVTGLATSLVVTGSLPTDVVQVLGQGGADRIDASGLPADAIGYGASGGGGDDVLVGGDGRDSLNGGDGDDLVDGRRADDSLFTGPGDDTIPWRSGEGSDRVGGEDGTDTLVFDGSDADERFVVAGDGFGGAVLTRDVGNIVMELDRLERIELRANGGNDEIVVDDLSDFRGTGLEDVIADLSEDRTAAAVDHVTVTGSDDGDQVAVSGSDGAVDVTGLPAQVRLSSLEDDDLLTVEALAGDDAVDATALARGAGLRVDAGAGDDTMHGGAGADVVSGGDGSDKVVAGSGDDVVHGGVGDDVLRGEDGDDVLDGGEGDDVLVGNSGDDVLLNGEVVQDD